MFCCYTTVHVTFQKLSLSFCFPLNLFQSETCVKVHHQLELWSRSRTCNIIHGCLKSSRFDLSQNYPHFFKQTFEQVCTFSVHKALVFLLFVCTCVMLQCILVPWFFLFFFFKSCGGLNTAKVKPKSPHIHFILHTFVHLLPHTPSHSKEERESLADPSFNSTTLNYTPIFCGSLHRNHYTTPH